MNNYKTKLFLQLNTLPIWCSARKSPYALQKKVEGELDSLEELGVSIKIEFSEWSTPILPIVKKDGSVPSIKFSKMIDT